MKMVILADGQHNTSKYDLEVSLPSNNAPPDGVSTDTVKATLTLDNKPVPGQSITFEIQSGSARFSDGTKEYVSPQLTQADGTTEATITDLTEETGNIVAWMTNNRVVESDPASYSFAKPIHKIDTFPVLDCATADGTSLNRILVAVANNTDGNVDKNYSGSVTFSTTDTNITFVDADKANPQRKTVAATRGFADASFTCSSSVGNAAYGVTVTAVLNDNSASGVAQGFTFVDGSSVFQLAYATGPSRRRTTVAGSYSVPLVCTYTGTDNANVLVGLSADNQASFEAGQSGLVNDKICKKFCQGVVPPQFTGFSITVVDPNAGEAVQITLSVPGSAMSPEVADITDAL